MFKIRNIFLLYLLLPIFLCAHKADLVVFSFDRPLQLWALLESVERNMSNVGHVVVIYRSSTPEFTRGYDEVELRFESVVFKSQNDKDKIDFKPLTKQAIVEGPSEYVFFAVDDIVVTEQVDLDACIRAMEDRDAYGFYLRLGLHLNTCYSMRKPQSIPAGDVYKDNFFVWCFKDGQFDWNYPHSVDMTVFRKRDIVPQIERLRFNSPNTLEGAWSGRAGHVLGKRGVCYIKAPIVNLPLNRVQHDWHNRHADLMSSRELLSLFQGGLKLDIEPLQGFVNDAAHVEYTPTFEPR